MASAPNGHVGAPLLVIAGTGFGKTNTLAHRVAHLIVSGSDPVHQFTAHAISQIFSSLPIAGSIHTAARGSQMSKSLKSTRGRASRRTFSDRQHRAAASQDPLTRGAESCRSRSSATR